MFLDIGDDPAVGGKARSLARLAEAGLPVPQGFVVADPLFRAMRAQGPAQDEPWNRDAPWNDDLLRTLAGVADALDRAAFPPGFVEDLDARLARLGGPRFSVRSSFAGEDAAGAVAAGVYESRVGVPAEEVPAAIRQVLRSALSAGAVAYGRAAGKSSTATPVAVLIHDHVEGDATGIAALSAPSGEPVIDARGARLARGVHAAVADALARLSARYGPVEIEWVGRGETVTFLQMRPYLPPAAVAAGAARFTGWDELPPGSPAPDRWRWDAAHNPLPLSPAQAGLVALVDERCHIGLRQRVLGGYLFYTPVEPGPEPIPPAQATDTLQALIARFETAVPRLGRRPPLEEALALFLDLYEPLTGAVGRAARRGRADLEEFLRTHAPSHAARTPELLGGVVSMATERRARAGRVQRAQDPDERRRALDEYLALFGDEADTWDVLAVTHAEAPEALSRRLAAHARLPRQGQETPGRPWQEALRETQEQLPAAERTTFDQLVATARACVAVGENDDWLYARLQAVVRRALLAIGDYLQSRGVIDVPEDIFYWPLPLTRAVAAGQPPPEDGRALASDGRARFETARRAPPTLTAHAPASPDEVVRGTGTSGRAVGTVVLRDGPLGPRPPEDAVLVATTLLPTELPLLEVAALVTETGGPLDHVASQARERRLPAVVGARGATSTLREGDRVVVDADLGMIVRLRR